MIISYLKNKVVRSRRKDTSFFFWSFYRVNMGLIRKYCFFLLFCSPTLPTQHRSTYSVNFIYCFWFFLKRLFRAMWGRLNGYITFVFFLIIFIKTKIGEEHNVLLVLMMKKRRRRLAQRLQGSTRACGRWGGHTGQHNSMKWMLCSITMTKNIIGPNIMFW